MQRVGNNNDLSIVWVPGHTGVIGNEEVDKLAKKAASLPVEGPEPFCGISLSVSKAGKRYWLRNAFCNYWARAPKMKFTHEMISIPSQRRSKSLIDLSKKKLRILTMFLTGHGIFRAHLKKIGLLQDSECRFCKIEEETAEHLIGSCSKFDYERCILFGKRKVTLQEISHHELRDLLSYLRNTKLLENFVVFDCN